MTGVDDAGVRSVLAGFEEGRAALAGELSITPLSGGLDNSSCRVSSTAGDWVVRIAGGRDVQFAINRVAECQVQTAAAALGFAPEIVYAEPERGLLVSEFLDGEVWTREQARSAAGIHALGTRLGQLHAQPPPRAVRRLNVHDVLAHYLETPAPARGPVSRSDLGARLRWSLATYRPPAPALCHNDLHHLNLIGWEPIRFVDWEYAGVGDPLFELASVIGYHDLDAEQRESLLVAHGGDFHRAHVARMCLVFDCLHALWLDAAGGWDSLTAERRDALLTRLTVDPAERQR
jgi:thiamine kinase